MKHLVIGLLLLFLSMSVFAESDYSEIRKLLEFAEETRATVILILRTTLLSEQNRSRFGFGGNAISGDNIHVLNSGVYFQRSSVTAHVYVPFEEINLVLFKDDGDRFDVSVDGYVRQIRR